MEGKTWESCNFLDPKYGAHKITRSSTIKNRAPKKFIKKIKKKNQEVHIKKMKKFDDYRKLKKFLVIKEWKQEVQK